MRVESCGTRCQSAFLQVAGEQVLEGGTGGAFVGYFMRSVAREFFVVALDFLVRWFELVGEGHGRTGRERMGIHSDGGMIAEFGAVAKLLAEKRRPAVWTVRGRETRAQQQARTTTGETRAQLGRGRDPSDAEAPSG
jgi:hypothetical protein